MERRTMGGGSSRRLDEIKTDSERQGWRWEETTHGWMAYAPDAVNKVLWHRQPSDPQFKACLRRMISCGYNPIS
jgi:hypothetical protein